jgi:inorganic pyrophosphatase
MTFNPSAVRHYINDVPYRAGNGLYHMVVEIPAGTLEKWQTDPTGGGFYHDEIAGKPRVINFLPYPFNYGFVPQTVLPKDKGGDGDPLDIITLAPAQPRGAILPVRVVGALNLAERGEIDTKIVGLMEGGPFADVQDIGELLLRYPGAIEIVRYWFEGYKGPGSFMFNGYIARDEAVEMIETWHGFAATSG